jgi:hypothetical protein
MSDILNTETGAEYTVVSDQHLGFTVKRSLDKRAKEHRQRPSRKKDLPASAKRIFRTLHRIDTGDNAGY